MGGGGGAGNPREFDVVKLYPCRDFDIHKGPLVPLGRKFDSVAILESGEGLGMSGPSSWQMPRSHFDEFPARSSSFPKGKEHLDAFKAKN